MNLRERGRPAKTSLACMALIVVMVTLCPQSVADEYTRIGSEAGRNASGEITP